MSLPSDSARKPQRWTFHLDIPGVPAASMNYEVPSPRLRQFGRMEIEFSDLHTAEIQVRDIETGKMVQRMRVSFSRILFDQLGPGTIEIMDPEEIEVTADKIIDALPARTLNQPPKENHEQT